MEKPNSDEENIPDYLNSRVLGSIEAEEIHIGRGVFIEEGVIITGKSGPAKRVTIGDNCYIGKNVKILAPEFKLGDYSKLNENTFAHGSKPLQIGRNCWIGGNCVLDSMGGLDIDDNVGIGAHSQIWTHIQFGDIVEGCRFYSNDYMHVGKDTWFVGHCIVSPVQVGERSMALAGSVITKDMEENHIYAGVPARDITEKIGNQFEEKSIDQKAEKLQDLIYQFTLKHPDIEGELTVARSPKERMADTCWFDVSTRTYNKTLKLIEVAFLKSSVPLIKFTPEGEGPFVVPQNQ